MTQESRMTPKELLESAGKLLQHKFEVIRASNPHAEERGQETEEILMTRGVPTRLPRAAKITRRDTNERCPEASG